MLNSQPQTDPETWELGVGSKPTCGLKQMLPALSWVQAMVDAGWLTVELVPRAALL